jgi:competence protein ComEC
MRLIFIFLILLIILCLRFGLFYQHIPRYENGQEIILQATLQEDPELSNRGQQFMIKTEQNQRIYIHSSLSTLYHYGDRLAISGKLQVSKNPKGFEFISMNFPKISVLPKERNIFLQSSRWVRERSLRLFEETLPPISSSLLLGIVYGAKGNFPDEFFQKLQTTGVLHVIAASGMNVSFFTGAVMFSLGSFLKRQIAIILSIFAVVFYSFLVGFEPSILRASTMAIIAFAASFFGRQTLALAVLFVTGFLMLLWQPEFLFDVGFQLSFLATLGILLVKPMLDGLGFVKKESGLQSFKQDLTTTLSAQIATFPILLGTFGRVGILSLLVNVLVLWTVPILMLLGSLAVLSGLIFAPFGKVFLLLSLPFLFFFEKVIDIFGSIGWALEVKTWPWELSVGYYLILAAIILSLRHKRINKQSI